MPWRKSGGWRAHGRREKRLAAGPGRGAERDRGTEQLKPRRRGGKLRKLKRSRSLLLSCTVPHDRGTSFRLHCGEAHSQLPIKMPSGSRAKSFFAALPSSVVPAEPPSLSELLSLVSPASGQWLQAVQSPASPAILILSQSALRAVELRRQAQQHCGRHIIAKLFAKHMKLKEQANFLAQQVTPVAVATPARLKQLIEIDALKLDELRLLAVDWYWRDAKLRRFSDVPEVWESFVAVYLHHLHSRVSARLTNLVLV